MARDAELSSYFGDDANKYATTADQDPDARVAVFGKLMGDTTKQKITIGAGDKAREVSVDVPTNSWADVFGKAPTYAEAKALQAAGLGNMTNAGSKNTFGLGVPVGGVTGLATNDPGQTADSVVAATDFTNVVGPIAKAAAMFIPGMSMAMTIKDLAEGKVTLGDITSNFALGLLAKQLGINVNVARAAINGDFGSALASTMIGQLNPALAKELGVNPALAGILGKESGAYGALTSAFNGMNQNWGTSKDISNAINTGFQNLGITTGTGGDKGATGQPINTGFSTQDAIDHYLSTSGGGSNTTTPTTTPDEGATGTDANAAGAQGNLFNPMGLTAPQTQQMTNAFPQLANVFYYGKDSGPKKQVLDENSQIVFEDQNQGLASGGRITDNKDDAVDAYIRHIVEQSGGPMSHQELLAIVKGI
jgi:hypothetical protein